MAFFGRNPPEPPRSTREKLTQQETQIADRVSRMRGVTRDEVLSEAYRRARLLDETESYHRERR